MWLVKAALVWMSVAVAVVELTDDVPSSGTKLKQLCSAELSKAIYLACSSKNAFLTKRNVLHAYPFRKFDFLI